MSYIQHAQISTLELQMLEGGGDGWLTLGFTPFSTVFQPCVGNERVILKGCVQ